MIGFLLHCDPMWNGMKHVLIVARDEYDMLQQLYDHQIATKRREAERHRVTAVFRDTEDWKRFEQFSLCELCCECGHGGTAA